MVTLSKGMCLLVMVAWVSFVTRLAFTGVHLYVGFKCSFNDTMISMCDGVDTLKQSTYDSIETASFFVEGTTLGAFVIVLLVWGEFYVGDLVRWHVVCTPVFYMFLGLIITSMVLELWCTLDIMVTGWHRIVWLVGYEFELGLYLVAVIFISHVKGKVLQRAIRKRTDLRPQRWVIYIAWRMFLMCSAIHSILFAAYDTMTLTSTLRKTHIKHTDTDSLSLVVSIAARSLLAGSFYSKAFDWPKSEERSIRVNRDEETGLGGGDAAAAAASATAASAAAASADAAAAAAAASAAAAAASAATGVDVPNENTPLLSSS